MLTGNEGSLIGIRVRVRANVLYPTVEAVILQGDLTGMVRVRVSDERYRGAEWVVPNSDIELSFESNQAIAQKAEPINGAKGWFSNTTLIPHRLSETPKEPPKTYRPSFTPKPILKRKRQEDAELARGFARFEEQPIKPNQKVAALNAIMDAVDNPFPLVSDGLYVHVDTVSAMGTTPNLDVLFRFLSNAIGEELFYEANRGISCGQYYESSAKATSGVRVGINQRFDEEVQLLVYDFHVSFPGKLLSKRPVKHWWKTFRVLKEKTRLRCSRIDIALDDFDKSVSFAQVSDALEAKNVKGIRLDADNSWQDTKGQGGGRTIYVGAKGTSDKLLRFYDKAVESKGQLDCFRWEMQLRGEWAKRVFDQWILDLDEESFDTMCPLFLGNVVISPDLFDFLDRASRPNEKNLKRCKRLEWWQKFCERIGDGIRLSRTRQTWSVARTTGWINRQVVTSLVVLKKILGSVGWAKWLSEEMERAEKFRLNRWHHHLIETYSREIVDVVAVSEMT